MTVSISTVHVFVDDPDAALPFYRDALGLTVAGDVGQGGFRWVTLAGDAAPVIVLSQPHAGRSRTDGDTIAALLAKGELRPLHLGSDDLAATFEKVAATPGVEVLEEPASRPWGATDCAVRDPAGNLIRIEQL
jgi:catechol 2,3-dioxygenase-like lactoylglutathione lyase family enzyme